MKIFSHLLVALIALTSTTQAHQEIHTIPSMDAVNAKINSILTSNPTKNILIFRCETHGLESLQQAPDVIIFISNKLSCLMNLQAIFAKNHPNVIFIGLHVEAQWKDQWEHY